MRINGKDVVIGEPKKTPSLMKSKPLVTVNSGLRGVKPTNSLDQIEVKSPQANYGGVR